MADVYTSVGGVPVRLTPEQAGEMESQSGFTPITEAQALGQQQGIIDTNLADQNMGTVGKALTGVVSGIPFGSGLVLGLANAGEDERTKAFRRHMWQGAESSTPGVIGKLAGIGLSTYATGGLFNPIESAAAKLLPETTGILGSMATGAVSMGARGAAEGSIWGLSNAVEEAALQNKGLAAEAMLAHMGDGAILGGALGAALGGAGGLIKGVTPKVAEAVESYAKNRIGPEAASNRLLGVMGAEGKAAGRIGAEFEGGTQGFLNEADEMVRKEGLRLSSDPKKLRAVAQSNIDEFGKIRSSVTREFDKAGTGHAPSWESFSKAVREEISAPLAMSPGGLDTGKVIDRWLNKMAPKPGQGRVSFEGWADSRDAIVKASSRLPEAKRVVSLYDAEIRKAMESAEQASPDLAGATGRYTSATAGKRVAEELESLMSAKTSAKAKAPSGDPTGALALALSGHPASAIGYQLGKVGYQALGDAIAPKIAESMWSMSRSAKAGLAVSELKQTIENGVSSFLRGTRSAAPAAVAFSGKKSLTREGFDNEIQKTYASIAKSRDDRFNDYLKATGSLAFANIMADKSDDAIKYVNQNIPAAKGRNGKDAGSIRPIAIPKTLDASEHLFIRKHSIVNNPFHALNELKSGSLSKDGVEALKQSWPETYALMVSEIQSQIADMSAAGKSLPMDKITQTSIMLGVPLTPTLEKPFIQEVQASMLPPPAPPGPPPSQQMSNSDNYATPVEKIGMG